MSICDRCIHAKVCGEEGSFDEALTYCCDFIGWVPVSERLPEENKTVMASTEYGVFPEARYTKKYGWEWAYESGADYWKVLDEVIAWMPLPSPYQAESEGVRNE